MNCPNCGMPEVSCGSIVHYRIGEDGSETLLRNDRTVCCREIARLRVQRKRLARMLRWLLLEWGLANVKQLEQEAKR